MMRPFARHWTVFAGAMAAFLPMTASAAAATSPGRLVDPFVGTLADFGQLSPAAVAPYGMVQLGPDTDPANHAGYDHAANRLLGFSHTRAVGVGCSGAGGDVRVSLDYAGAPAPAAMDKRREAAHAGYYRVAYGGGILAEMTVTRGAGVVRFTLPRPGRVTLTVDFAKGYSRRHAAAWRDGGDGELRASFSAGTVCDAGIYHLHSASRLLRDRVPVAMRWTGAGEGRAALTLTVRAGERIELRTGLSTVDPAAASAVREAELGSRPFSRIAAGTLADWDAQLSRLTIAGPRRQRALFHTAVFRVMQTPVAVADPDGRFRGSDGALVRLPAGEQHYTGWALWDNYRTQMPLLALVDPPRAAAIARSLVRLYGSGKQRWATPREPFPTVRTEHAGIVLLDFHRKGITGFDAQAALAGMVAESPRLQRGTPDQRIEAAYDDWAIAELAADLRQPELAARFRAKAQAYRPMWLETFRELGDDADVVRARGLYQGTLAQYRWAPVFDLPWMAEALGARFRPELQRFFAHNLFNMTNQPDIHAPFLLAWAGDRVGAARIIRRYVNEPVPHRYTNAAVRAEPWVGHSFALAPQGFADGMDDDAGTMSAWYVWSVLGLYPLVPGEPWYMVTGPLSPRVAIRGGGRTPILLEQARNNAIVVNRRTHSRPILTHGALIASPG